MKARENAPNGTTIELTLSPGESFGEFHWPETATGTTQLVILRAVNPASPQNLIAAQEADIAALKKAVAGGLKIAPWSPGAASSSVPISVSSAQAMIQLSRMPHDGSVVPGAAHLAEATEKLVEQSDDYELKTWFARAQRWVITNPNVKKIGAAFKLTDDEILAAFEAAAKIEE